MINYIEHIVGLIITAVLGAIGYLVRTVLTNKAEIELLKSDIVSRDKRRDEDRQLLLDLKADLKAEMKETRGDIESVRSELTEFWKSK
jgi:hypothetical protein